MRQIVTALLLSASLSGCGNGDGMPAGNAADAFTPGKTGERVDRRVAQSPTGSKHWLDALVTSQGDPEEDSNPAKIAFVKYAFGCNDVPKFETSQRLVVLITNEIEAAAPIYTYVKGEIDRRAQALVTAWRAKGSDPGVDVDAKADALGIANVVITDTKSSVYIVLSGPDKTLWNFQMASGVKLAGVAILGATTTAVANVPASVPVTFMPDDLAKSCRAMPARKPGSTWGIVDAAKTDTAARTLLAQREAAATQFSNWFRAIYKIEPETFTIGAESLGNFLIGPEPADTASRLPFARLSGSLFRMSEASDIITGSRADFVTKHAELVRSRAKAQLGADLKSLDRK